MFVTGHTRLLNVSGLILMGDTPEQMFSLDQKISLDDDSAGFLQCHPSMPCSSSGYVLLQYHSSIMVRFMQ